MILISIINGDSVYIMHNSYNTRIISEENDCSNGRIELWDGTKWGSFRDCAQTMTIDMATSMCQSLGFEMASSFSHGPEYNETESDLGSASYIAYTDIYCPSDRLDHFKHCSFASLAEACEDCLLEYDLSNSCQDSETNGIISEIDLHSNFDVYITCSFHPQCDYADGDESVSECTEYTFTNISEIYDNKTWSTFYWSSTWNCEDAYDSGAGAGFPTALFVVIVTAVVCGCLYGAIYFCLKSLGYDMTCPKHTRHSLAGDIDY